MNKATEKWICLVSPENVSRWGIKQGSLLPTITTLGLLWDVPISDWAKNRSQILSHTWAQHFVYSWSIYFFIGQGTSVNYPISGNQRARAWGKIGVKTEGRLFIFPSASSQVSPCQVSTLHALLIREWLFRVQWEIHWVFQPLVLSNLILHAFYNRIHFPFFFNEGNFRLQNMTDMTHRSTIYFIAYHKTQDIA